jgi:hypothetical protein
MNTKRILFGIVLAVVMASFGGCDKKSGTGGSTQMTTPSRGATVTANRLWKCPKCGKVLEKRGLGMYWNPGDPISRVAGNATCGNCMSRYDQADVYGGKYDLEEKAKESEQSDIEAAVSVITYQLSSTSPPSNARAICEEILKKKYPKAQLDKFYCIGRSDAKLTPDEGLVQYKEFVREGQLPDLGTQFGTFTGRDITDKEVVVLFFRK